MKYTLIFLLNQLTEIVYLLLELNTITQGFCYSMWTNNWLSKNVWCTTFYHNVKAGLIHLGWTSNV